MFKPEELHFEPHPLAQSQERFDRIFPHVHPMTYKAVKLLGGYRDYIPSWEIPNDPDFPQNWKVRRGFMHSAVAVLYSLREDGVITDPDSAAKIEAFEEQFSLEVGKKTTSEDIAKVNSMLSLALKFALTPISRN